MKLPELKELAKQMGLRGTSTTRGQADAKAVTKVVMGKIKG